MSACTHLFSLTPLVASVLRRWGVIGGKSALDGHFSKSPISYWFFVYRQRFKLGSLSTGVAVGFTSQGFLERENPYFMQN